MKKEIKRILNKSLVLLAILSMLSTYLPLFSSISFAKDNENVAYDNVEDIKTSLDITGNNSDHIINIAQLSDDFMVNYFEEYEELQNNDNKENILIVTSTNEIEDVYGATDVIEAPNNQYFLQYNSEEEKNYALESFNEDKKILDVEENIIYKALENTEIIEKSVSNTNEKKYNSWGIKAMGLEEAPEIIGSENPKDVTVAIIDTGCDMELFNQYYSGRITETYNVIDPNKSMEDTDGHGTHIAGTIAEGTPSNVKILPIKVAIDGDKMYSTDIITAINYVVENNKADIINMSYGSYAANDAEKIAIQAAKESNIICVAAAGNDNVSKMHYPSSYAETISIASCDYYLNKSNFSNYGSTITFTAPGSEITSINGLMSGTSMATPHAVNAVAILKSFDKDCTLEEVIETLKNYTIDLGDTGWDKYYGWGFIKFNKLSPCSCTCNECNGFVCACSDKVELDGEVELTNYNYGNITNLSPIKLNITNGLRTENVSLIESLDDNTLGNINLYYNPNSTSAQDFKLSFGNSEIILHIDAKENYQNAWEYEILEDNQIKLTGMKEEDTVIKILGIPEKIDDYTVTEIDFGMSQKIKEDLKILIIPRTFKKIGDYSFKDCKNLEKITKFSQSVDSPLELGNYSFSGCSKLTFPATSAYDVNKIGNLGVGTFENCTSLKIDQIPFGDYNMSCLEIPERCFAGCISIEGFIGFGDVEYIGKEAFKDCINIGSIQTTATTIGESAFEGCINLVNPQLKVGTKYINSKAFYGCGIATRGKILNSLSLPTSIEFIAEDAFADIYNVNYITLGSPNEFYEEIYVAEDGKITDWNAIIEKNSNKLVLGCMNTIIPDTVTSIGDYAFYAVNKLTDIEIPEGVQTIGKTSFAKCSTLNTVTIPKSVTSIGNQAFLDIEDSVTLKVYENSYAHTYAKNNNIKYELIKEGITISGTVTSYGSDKSELTSIQLIKDGEESPSQSITVSGKQSTYEIFNVLEGNYTIKVLKNNHVTREYSITVDDVDITQNIKICLIGDINEDGKLNIKDWNKLYNHINETNLLNDYQFLCADVNEDGKVNIKDWNRVYNHINEVNPLW